MNEYHFKTELARRYGVDGAVFLHSIAFWVAKNQAAGRHFHQGRTWTYNSLEALTGRFPFWSRRQIERIIARLREQGALLTGNFNRSKTDRTAWYALTDPVLELYGMAPSPISPEGEMHLTKRGEPSHQRGNSNKESDTDQVSDPPLPPGGKQQARETVEELLERYAGADRELARALEDLMEVRAAKKAVNSPRAVATLLGSLDRYSGGRRELKLRLVEQSVTNSWKGIFPLKDHGPAPRREEERHVE